MLADRFYNMLINSWQQELWDCFLSKDSRSIGYALRQILKPVSPFMKRKIKVKILK